MSKIKNHEITELPQLISKLKIEDARTKRKTKAFTWLMALIIPFYAFIFFFLPEERNAESNLLGISYVVAFAAFALFFWLSHKEFKEIDYSLPTLAMLKKVVSRYKFKLAHPRSFLLLIPVLLIDINSTYYLITRTELFEEVTSSIIIIQLIYFISMGTSLSIGFLIWRKRQKPILDYARSLINEIEGI